MGVFGRHGVWKMIERIQEEVSLPADKSRTAGRRFRQVWHLRVFVLGGGETFPAASRLPYDPGTEQHSSGFQGRQRIPHLQHGACRTHPDRRRAETVTIEDLVRTAHEKGLYLIGRIVVFRDKQLYNADNYKNAAWTGPRKSPGATLKERGRADGRRNGLPGRVLGGPILRVRVGLQHRHRQRAPEQGRGRGAVRLHPFPLRWRPGAHHGRSRREAWASWRRWNPSWPRRGKTSTSPSPRMSTATVGGPGSPTGWPRTSRPIRATLM